MEAKQYIEIDDNGVITVTSAAGIITSNNENPTVQLQGMYEISALDVAKLIAMSKKSTFFNFKNQFSCISSDDEVKNKLKEIEDVFENEHKRREKAIEIISEKINENQKSHDATFKKYETLNKSLETACSSAEKRFQELEMKIDTYNEMPWIRRIFSKITK